MRIADERHDLTVDLGLDVEAATPLGAVIEDQVEHDERAGEFRRGPSLQANMASPAESTALVLENDPGVSRHPPDARPGRNGLRLHLEDVGEVRIQLHDERRAEGVIRERSDQEVVVHGAGDPASDVEQQGPLGDAARGPAEERVLELPRRCSMTLPVPAERLPRLAADRGPIRREHTRVRGEQAVLLVRDDPSFPIAGQRRSVSMKDLDRMRRPDLGHRGT
jgi:hypothetical protein